MRKFKIGDKVRIVDTNMYTDIKKGDIGIITEKKSGEEWLLVEVAGYKKGLQEIDNRWELVAQTWKEKMKADK